jgi:hypothetical protein
MPMSCRPLPVLLFSSLLLGSACQSAPPAPPVEPPDFTAVAAEALLDQARDSPGTFAWNYFLFLNQDLTNAEPKRWEKSFRQTSSVFLTDGCKPTTPFGRLPPVPTEVARKVKELPSWGPKPGVLHNLDTEIQVDGMVLRDKFGAQPTQAKPVRYQLLMDEKTFDYVLLRQFYNVEGQELAAGQNQPARFPILSRELKTSWIWIGTDRGKYDALKASYYIVTAYHAVMDDDGKPLGWGVGYAALTGMHVIVKTQPKWMWITFENVHNPKFTQITLELPIPDYAVQANQEYQTRLQRARSIFANYQLDGVQLDFNDATGKPILLANSNIESAFQSESSCMTCHATSSVKPNGEHFDFVDRSGGNVGYYVGNPPSLAGWTFLDYVWTMKRAYREGNCPSQEAGR